jgi:hypothetical protein
MRAVMIVALVVSCSNKLSGSVEINGEKLQVESCRNGVVHGFRGVELTGTSGVRLRIAATPSGEAEVFVIDAGATVGKQVPGKCGALQISDQNSTINDVKNVEGKATLDCTADGFTVKGEISFENCH